MTDSGPTTDYLEQYHVPCVPEVYYIPDFITEHEEEYLPRKARSNPSHPSRGIIKDGVLAGQSPRARRTGYNAVRSRSGVGSHTVFNYYKHADGPSNAGSAVDRTTLVSLLLEPRSFVITRSSLYTGHVHGIEERTQAVLGGEESDGVKVANAHLVRAEEARTGGTITREARMSLTYRDVERVLTVKRSGK